MKRNLLSAALAACSILLATVAVASDRGQPSFVPASPSGLLSTPMFKSGTTYVLEADNENNAGTGTADGDFGLSATSCIYNDDPLHPIEFNIFVTGALPTTSAVLFLEMFDVDFASGERDEVYVNNTLVGVATGANGQWSSPSFTIPSGVLVAGKNTVRVQVDVLNPPPNSDWCTTIRRAQLVIDGGAAATASCRAITTSAQNYLPGATVPVTVEADTSLTSQSLRFEVNIKNASSQIINGTTGTFTVNGTANDAQTFNIGLGSAPNGTYTAEALLFDSTTSVFQGTCSVNFTVGAIIPDNKEVPTLGTLGLGLLALLVGAVPVYLRRRRR